MPGDQELFDAVLQADRDRVIAAVRAGVDGGTPVSSLLMDCMVPAMREIGDRFAAGELFIPEMLFAARAMQAGLDIVEPLLGDSDHGSLGRVAVGTVKGDMHDIGKNLVVMMLKGGGYRVTDLGVDCSLETYEAAVAEGSTVLCCSALLTSTMTYMKQVVGRFQKDPAVKVIVGGAPVTRAFAEDIGADGFAEHASEATRVVSACLAGSAPAR
ncbi:MAG: cobalamin-binding protein [Planctomycetes bacterium]|nr:cobalamin-binding protein [Planctomycetota bacterium]